MLGGCYTGRLPDPNDSHDGPVAVELLNKQMRSLNEGLYTRWQKGEFNERTYLSLLSQGADEILQGVKLEGMDPDDLWQYGEVLRTAKRWPEAEKILRLAVKYAKEQRNEDRRVNDSLRLAQAEANLGKIDKAITTTKSTFDVRNEDAVPVMMGTLYEIIPAARGKGYDLQLAELLEGAIQVHERAVVDPKTDSGKAFLMARPGHIRRAWATIGELYESAHRPDLAAKAVQRSYARSI